MLESRVRYDTSRPYEEESESSHENPSTTQFGHSTSTPHDLFVEVSPEPRTPNGEEIQPSEFTSKFEDDRSRYLLDTSNSFVDKSGEDPHSIQINHSKNLTTELSPRPSVLPLPPDPPDEACLEEAIWME
jgi:hypothetical protein